MPLELGPAALLAAADAGRGGGGGRGGHHGGGDCLAPGEVGSEGGGGGIYFKGAVVNFGEVGVGAVADRTLRLCNGCPVGGAPAAVALGDPPAPFGLRHHHLALRGRAYVKVPIRFSPAVRGDFEVTLTAHRLDTPPGPGAACSITLIGTAV